jgi:hypothetical protein
MDRNSSSKREFLSDSEIAKRSAPSSRLDLKGAQSHPLRDGKYVQISDGSAPAIAEEAQHRRAARSQSWWPSVSARAARMAIDYKPDLPADTKLPPGFSVNTSDPRYVALRDLASRENLSQSAFSQILKVEADRVNSEYERARAAAPAPVPNGTPARPAPAKAWEAMSSREQFAHALANSPGRRPLT